MAGRVFRRTLDPSPPVAVRAERSTIWDADGRAYLDAAGGAIVVGIGHGRRSVAEVMAEQAGRVAFAHGSAFTSEPLERYAQAVGRHLPMADPAIYPVAGGSEAMETALKMARAYHLARGERDRWIVIARWGSYHGNTLGALDLSGRRPLRRPYESWLGRFRHVSAAYPYRAGEPNANALGTAEELAEELDRTIVAAGPGTVAAFVGEPFVGATLGAVAPPPGYWPAIAGVCHRHGVLLVADEVMTGFGRTGRWFGIDHAEVRPDILVAAKGATSGYAPFGFAAASGEVHDAIVDGGGFTHGFTYSHHVLGAAVAGEVLRILEAERLVEASATKGARLRTLLVDALADHRHVGELRVHGLFAGLELVADRETRAPFPRAERVAERIVREARGRGLLVYSGTGMADGTNGDAILLGPPFVVTDEELATIVDGLAAVIEDRHRRGGRGGARLSARAGAASLDAAAPGAAASAADVRRGRIRAVAFDVGETLFDETRAWGLWADWLGVPRLTLFAVLGGVIERGEDHRRALEIVRAGTDVDAEVARKDAAGLEYRLDREDLYPDALPALGRLRSAGFRLAIAANQPVSTEDVVSGLDVEFEVIASSSRWGVAKPEPAFFARLAGELDLPPAAIAYVGDRVDYDIRPAAEAGMAAIHIRRGPWGYAHAATARAAGAVAQITSLAELPEVLAQLG